MIWVSSQEEHIFWATDQVQNHAAQPQGSHRPETHVIEARYNVCQLYN